MSIPLHLEVTGIIFAAEKTNRERREDLKGANVSLFLQRLWEHHLSWPLGIQAVSSLLLRDNTTSLLNFFS